MDKDKQVMPFEGEQALVRVNVQMGLVNKVLEEDERLFSKTEMVMVHYDEEINKIKCTGLILIQRKKYIMEKEIEIAIIAFLKINFWYYLSKIMDIFKNKNNFCTEFDEDIIDSIAQNNLNYEYPRSFYRGGGGVVTKEYDSEIASKNGTYILCSPPITDKFTDKILRNINNKIAGEFLMAFAGTSIGKILGIKTKH
jgi:hypothetical protein